MKSFLTRAITAVIAIAVVLILFSFTGAYGLKSLGWLAVIIGGSELVRILFPDVADKKAHSAFYILLITLFSFNFLWPKFSSLFFSFSIIIFVIFVLSFYKSSPIQKNMELVTKGCLGLFYLGMLPGFSLQILELPQGTSLFSSFLIVVFSGDIGAYLAGSLFGKHKIFPHISPKKSYQGALGGVVMALSASLFCYYFFEFTVSIVPWIGLCSLISIVAMFGDFFESLLKRVADIKDSGTLMPGHGGVLDRLDGVLFASPVMLFGIQMMDIWF